MRADVAKDLTASAACFKDIVWPEISEMCGGGHIVPVEGVTVSEFAKTLDVLSGIDAWQVVDGVGVRGVASRVQWGRDWGTFTVRKSRASGSKTEWDKIAEARELALRGFVRPHLVVQAYVSGTRENPTGLAAAYVVAAPDLYRLCQEQFRGTAWKERTIYDGNTMAVFDVNGLRRSGAKVARIAGAV